MKIGFIGLGNMGLPMAQNLARAGHDVSVWNRTREKAAAAGAARIADSPADAARGADAVITMLADDAAVEQAVFGESGILAAPPTAIHVGCSTISVDLSRRLAQAHAERGQQYIAAPVFGRPQAAAAAQLAVVAAGPSAAIDRCRPIFDAIGNKLFIAGEEPEKANIVKLAGNFMIASAIATMGQAIALLRKSGVDPAQWLAFMTDTLFPAGVYRNYGNIIVQQQYQPAGFRMRLGLKDVRLVLAAAEAAGVPMPTASLLRDDALTAIANGMGDDDWSSIARVAAQRAGLDV